ncbi:MAG TPA: divalent-cation tolerance protein CutA [Candidatus Acidoferrales bacterium]
MAAKGMTGKLVVLVTCASRAQARKIARAVVGKRLAACVNIAAGRVESVYRWKGKVERAQEVLLVIKTTRARYAALQREVRRLHSYTTPEVIALPIAAGSKAYLDWVAENSRA